MKKLTAGIFATLLAVVSVGAAHAEIASKGYVDQQVGTKADASTVTSLQGTVSGHTSQIGTINDTIGGYGNIVTHDADEFATSAQGAKADTAVQPDDITNVERTTNKTQTVNAQSTEAQYPSAKAVWTAVSSVDANASVEALEGRVGKLETASATHATKTELTEGLADKANTADLGTLAKLNAVGSAQITDGAVATADIANKAVTEAKLSDTVNASLDKADSALQQGDLDDYVTETEANAAYAVKTLEGQVGVVSKENMGTTTATTVVAGVKEAIDAAKAADTKAGNAATAASGAQSAVDAVESTIGGYGDIVSHNASDFATAAQGSKADTAVQPAAISDMLTKTEAGTTYYTKTSGDALAGRVTTAEGDIDTIQGQISNMATSDTVTKLTERVTTAEGDIDDLEAAVNDAESGLAATNAIADSALSTAQSAQTTANAALPKATYNSQVGTVSATNMGTSASTVVAAIKEVAGKASGAQSAASAADSKAQAAQSAAEAADSKAQAAQTTANAAIPKPSGECADGTAKCVLTFNNSAYAWEVIARNGEGE